jgi:uncharacterized metal-binding protein YceD (DUF177 family)
MPTPLNWTHDAAAADGAGCQVDRQASDSERQAIAKALGLLVCDHLAAAYRLKANSADRVLMTGAVKAKGQQACVVTGDPVPFTIDEPLEVEFTTSPPLDQSDEEGEEREVLTLRDVEVMDGGLIDAGRIIYEMVSVTLDPYPRRPGVALSDQGDTSPEESDGDRPFAALKHWKKPS